MDTVWGYCELCRRDGTFRIPEDSWDKAYFVKCSECGWEDAHVFCPNCEMGGWLVENDVIARPDEWKCRSCGSEWTFPDEFYKNPKRLKLIRNEFADRVIEKGNRLLFIVVTLSFIAFMCWGVNEFIIKFM